MRSQLDNQEKKLDDLLKSIGNLQDDELKAHMSKYFCIRISGYLENVVKTLVSNYSDKSCPAPISNYIRQDLKNITNLSRGKLERVLKKFSDNWKEHFLEKISDKQIESLNSIIANRNVIAHGQDGNISHKVVGDYYSDLKEVVAILKGTIKKNN